MFSDDVEQLLECSTEELEEGYRQLLALERSVRVRRMAFLAALDHREVWRESAVANTEQWVAYAALVRPKRAREEVAIARGLAELPQVAAVATAGRLSDDQLLEVVKVADAATDAEWAKDGPSLSPAQIATRPEARATRRAEDAERLHRGRYVRIYRQEDQMILRGQLPLAEGHLVDNVINRLVDSQERDTDHFVDYAVRRADALVELVRTASEHEPGGRADVVVHVSEEALRTGEGWAQIGEDSPVAAEVARRLSCDSSWQVLLEGKECQPLGLGRKTRSIPTWLRRSLMLRDQGCRFPGCGYKRGLHGHHIEHWANGGPTDPDNLVMLCYRHHHLVHEGGWTLTGDATKTGGLIFTDRFGKVLSLPPPLRSDIRGRFFGEGDVGEANAESPLVEPRARTG